MAKLDIPVRKITLDTLYIASNGYTSIEFDLQSVNDKKIGTYKINDRERLSSKTVELLEEFTKEVERSGAISAEQELNLIEANND